MKDSFKNTLPLDRKKLSAAGVSERIYKKWFVLARKPVPTIRNEAFVEKCVSTIRKNCFFWQQKNLRKWFPLAGKCFLLKLVSPNFNNGFQHQKKKLRWCCARDLFGSQIPVTTGGFQVPFSCRQSGYLRPYGPAG